MYYKSNKHRQTRTTIKWIALTVLALIVLAIKAEGNIARQHELEHAQAPMSCYAGECLGLPTNAKEAQTR